MGTPQFVVNSIVTSDHPEVNYEVTVTANATNTGECQRIAASLWIQKEGESSWSFVANSTIIVDPDQSGDFVMTFIPSEAGIFNMKIMSVSTEETLKTATVKIAGQEEVVVDGVKYLCTPDYQYARVVRNEDADRSVATLTILPSVSASGVSCKVIAVGSSSFERFNKIKTLEIPEGVTTIGTRAMANCQLLNKVVLPSTLMNIEEEVFENNSNMVSVVSHIQNPPIISDFAFIQSCNYNFEREAYDLYPSPATLYVPVGTKAKYEAICGWTQFAEIVEGELEETMVDGLKYACATGTLKAKVIQDDSYKSLTEVTVPATVTIDGNTYQVTAIGSCAFQDCYRIVSVTLPEGLQNIGNSAFRNTNISGISLPGTLTSIGDYAFRSCPKVQSMTVPEGVEIIGKYAFSFMSKLSKLELPHSLKSIGNGLIQNCQDLSAVVSHITEPFAVDDGTFIYKSSWNEDVTVLTLEPSPATLYVPKGTKTAYEALTGWTYFAGIQEMEQREAVVDGLCYSYVFYGTTATVIHDDSYENLTEVTVPATVTIDGNTYQVTAIGDEAFRNCYNLSSVTLSDGLESIGYKAFQHIGVSDMTLPSSLKTIGDFAFEDCYGIKTLVVPEGVESIGNSAFHNMISLTRLELPSTLREIGELIFVFDDKLNTVISYADEPFAVNENTFKNRRWNNETMDYDILPPSATLYVPDGTKEKYEALTGWNQFGTIYELGDFGSGDANGDGKVTITDAVAVVNYILGNASTGFSAAAADVNHDGKITITDAVGIVNIILNK